MTQPPEILLDRRTGRSSDEFGIEDDLTFKERVALFEQAEYSLGFAEAAQDRGYQKSEVYGETREIDEALTIFRESAEFHASRIDEKEIAVALERKEIDPGIASALRERQEANQKRDNLDDAADKAISRYASDDGDRSQNSEEHSRDEDQER